MKHLTIDEMIAFVSISELDTASLELASRVNTHIVKCDLCRSKVSAFQEVFDELNKAGTVESESGRNAADYLSTELQKRFGVSNDKQPLEETEMLER